VLVSLAERDVQRFPHLGLARISPQTSVSMSHDCWPAPHPFTLYSMRSSWTSAAAVRIPTPRGTGAAYGLAARRQRRRVDAIAALFERLAEDRVDPHLEKGRILLRGQEFFDEHFPASSVEQRVERAEI
jgi:hypothetical protein